MAALGVGRPDDLGGRLAQRMLVGAQEFVVVIPLRLRFALLGIYENYYTIVIDDIKCMTPLPSLPHCGVRRNSHDNPPRSVPPAFYVICNATESALPLEPVHAAVQFLNFLRT
nr:hypothetical protein KPHV_00410 [Kitasatospora purpeofusca]BEK71212.1 hypothetical protein KPHV_84390 [Kitasatospora purpeofusca]